MFNFLFFDIVQLNMFIFKKNEKEFNISKRYYLNNYEI